MAGLINLFARGAGLVIGTGAVRRAREQLGTEARPAVKATVRAGLEVVDRLEGWAAGAREQLDAIVEEVRAEQRKK